ncbi:splicing factor, arginine/serine-rich 19-like [Anguilla rostrata]|uniref:splicing factor, arginine/serine-rich 19-like n=1 Tax=Anguilla rostrata TaxID=7938 RepID=UPI0030CA6215
MEEEEGFENVPSDGPKSLQEKCHKEREGVEEERRAGMRCNQDQRETSDDQPSELDAAALAVSDSLLPLVSLHCSPHQPSDSIDFDLELTAEVRVEDGSSLAFLSSISHRFHSRKSGTLLDHLPLQLKHQSLTWISKPEEQFLNNFQCPIFLPTQPQVIIVTPESMKNKVNGSLLGAMQAPKSPLPSCPSTPSSPSSAPSSPSSSPSSSSSSPVAAATSFHDRGHGCVAGVSQSEGGTVSSTSISLPLPTRSLPLSSTPSVHRCSTPSHPGSGEDQENVEIYDPFHPTEGEGEREGGAAKEEEDEEEGDKYDPFDPTGSPASEREKERRVECILSVESERGETMGVTGEQKEGSDNDEKEMTPSYFIAPPSASPISTDFPSHHPRRREERGRDEREQEKAVRGKGPRDRVKDKGKGGRERKETNSDNSEIEEGEIVAAGERDRKKKRDRDGERGHFPDSSFLPSCPKPERILRVLEGDDFVSVRAEGDWMVERDGGTTTSVGDLRRKLVSRRKERYRSCPSSASLSPPPPLPLATPPPSRPTPTEKAKSRKSSKSSKERERRKRKQEGEIVGKRRRKKAKEGGSQERKEGNKDSERQGRDKKRKEGASWSSRSGSSKRKKRRTTPELPSHSRSHTSLHQHHSQRSWSSTAEDRHKDRERDRDRDRHRDRERDRERERERDREREHERDRDRDRNRNGRRDDKERRRERDHSSQRRKRERGEGDEELGDEERGTGCRQRASREQREQDRERERRRRDGRPVVPPSIQDLNGSDLFAIKRTITVTTTTTTTTLPGSPQLPQTASGTPPPSSNKQHKKKHKRKRRLEEEDYADDEEGLSRSRDSSLTPLRYRLDYDSDHFSDTLGVDMLSLDGEALDSDYSLEGSPLLPLPPLTPTLSTKTKPKLKCGTHSKKKSRTGKKTTATDSSLRQKASKSPPSLSPTSTPSVPTPTLPMPTVAKRARKTGKEKEKVGKKEGGRSGKSKKLSSGSTKKGKLQSKVSVLVREGVSSTTGGSGSGKLGGIASTKDLAGPGGASTGTVVGGSIAVVFRRDNESRSPFLKPSSEPISLSRGSKEFGKGRKTSTLVHPSSSSSHVSVLKSKKAKPSSTTSASSSAASSPSSFSLTKCRRKLGKKQKEREKGRVGVQGDGANTTSCVEGGSWPLSVSDIQSGSTGSAKPSSPPPGPPVPTPSSSSSSSSSTSVPPPLSPPCTPPVGIHPSRDTRESTPDSQTVDSSCKTPEPNFLSEDGPTQSQTTPLTSPSNVPSSPLPHQAAPGGVSGISQSTPDLNNPMDDQKTPTSPPCSSSSNSLSVAPSSVEPNSSVSSSSANKPPPPPPPPPAAQPLPWSLQTGVDCTAGGVLALTALLFKMEEANLANRAKAQEFIQATSQILSHANQSQSQQLPLPPSSSSSSSQPPPPSSLATPPGSTPAQFILHSSLPLVGCTKTPPSHLHPSLSLAGGCTQTPPHPMLGVSSGAVGASSETGWDSESKDPEKYMKKLHTQERAVEEVKLAIKPYYQRKDITKEEYKDILRKAVHKICHSRTGEINPVKVSNLVKLYVQRYKYFRKHGRKMDEEEREGAGGGVTSEPGALHSSM